jgi:CrcB protein
VTLLLVMVGGALGATCRFLIDRVSTARVGGSRWLPQGPPGSPLPWGTFFVNVGGSLLLGLLVGAGAALPGWLGHLLGTGFCGALTTYSTFSYETVRLAAAGPSGRGPALLNIAATIVVGLAAAGLGWLLARQL